MLIIQVIPDYPKSSNLTLVSRYPASSSWGRAPSWLASCPAVSAVREGYQEILSSPLDFITKFFVTPSHNTIVSPCNLQTARLSSGAALSYLACYGGGVILATCFTHMMPEVDRFLETNIRNGQLDHSLARLPLAEIFVLVGFYLIYSIEEGTHFLIDRYAGTTGLSGDHHEAQVMVVRQGKQGTEGSKTKIVSALRGFLVVLALSLHELFEGMALGLATTERSVEVIREVIDNTLSPAGESGCCSWLLDLISSSSLSVLVSNLSLTRSTGASSSSTSPPSPSPPCWGRG